MEHIQTDDAPASTNPLSQAVVSNGFVFVAGQTGRDPEDGALVGEGVGEQTRQALENVAAILEAAGSSLDDAVRVTAYLVDIDEKDAFNRAYDAVMEPPYPARAVIGGAELTPGAWVELEVLAEQ